MVKVSDGTVTVILGGWLFLLLRLCGVETWSLQLVFMMSLIAFSLMSTLAFYF